MLENFNLILNMVFVLIIILSVLMGLLRGMRKSIFQFIMSMVFLTLAVIVIPYIASALLEMNIEAYKHYFPAEIQEHVTTIKGTVASYLQTLLPDQQHLFEPGSETLEIVYGVIKLVLELVLYLVYFVFSMTILKIITLIVWLFVRPKEKVPKRRLIGALVGGVRGIIAVMILAIPLVGISSIYGSVKTITNPNVTLDANNQAASPQGGISEFDKYLLAYDNTWVGKTFDLTNFDEVMFDYIFKVKIKINGKTESINIRRNIYHGAKVYETIMRASDGQLDETAIFKLTNEDIDEIKKNLEKTDIFKLVQVVAVEFLYNEIVDRNLAVDYEEHLTLENLKAIDLKNDVITIFSVLQIINEVEFTGENVEEKIFSLEKDTVIELVDEVAKIEWLEYLLPMAINYVLNDENLQEVITEYGIDKDDITKPTPEELVNDFKNIQEVYLLLKDVDVKSFDEVGELFADGAFLELDDDKIERLVNVVFDFEIINSNMKLIAAFGHNALEQQEELQGLISRDEFLENFDEEEIKSVLLLAKVLVVNHALSEDIDLEALLTKENIENIADILANSKLISLLTPKVLEMIFDNFAEYFELEVPDDISYKGEEGKTEIMALLKAIEMLYRNDFLTSDFDPSKISDEDIREIAERLSEAITIKHNITAIVQKLVNDQNLDKIKIKDYVRDHWSVDEILHTLMTFKLLSEFDLLDSEVEMSTITDDQIQRLATNMSSSVTIRDNITPIFEEVVQNLNFDQITIDYESDHWDYDEIYHTVTSIRLFQDYGMLSDTFDMSELVDDQIKDLATNMSSSITIKDNITSIFKEVVKNLEYDEITVDYESDHWDYDEIYHTVTSMKLFGDYGMLSSTFDMSELSDTQLNNLSTHMSSSNTIRDNITPIFQEVVENLEYTEITINYTPDHWEKDELYHTFKGLKSIQDCGLLSSLDLETLTDEKLRPLSRDLSSSLTIRDSITPMIRSVMSDQGSKIVVNNDSSDWTEDEIFHTLRAFRIVQVEDILLEDNSDILATSMSRSKTVNSMTKELLEEAIDNYDYEIELVILENEEYKDDQGEIELRALFKAIKSINNNNMLNPGFDVGNLDDQVIEDDIAVNLSASKTVRTNISAIVNHISDAKGYDFVQSRTYEESHWSGNELKYTMKALKLFDVNELTSENIHTLPDEDISTIAKSKTIAYAFGDEVVRMNDDVEENTSPMKGQLVFPPEDEFVWESVEQPDGTTTPGEVENILISIKIIQGENHFSDFVPNIDNLFGKENKQQIFKSKIILRTFVENHLKPLIKDEDKLGRYFEEKDCNGNEYRWYADEDNDTVAFVQALDDLAAAGIDYKTMSYYSFRSVLKEDPDNNPQKVNDAIVQSRIFTHSLNKMMAELLEEGGVGAYIPFEPCENPEDWGTPGHPGKLLEMLKAIANLPDYLP